MQERERPAKPRDAQTVEAILKTMGVESYDPRVVNQLLELLYRYVSSVLTDSRMFSEHADKTSIDLDDIKLAIRLRCNFTFTQPPPRDVTMRLVAERNVVPIPDDGEAGTDAVATVGGGEVEQCDVYGVCDDCGALEACAALVGVHLEEGVGSVSSAHTTCGSSESCTRCLVTWCSVFANSVCRG